MATAATVESTTAAVEATAATTVESATVKATAARPTEAAASHPARANAGMETAAGAKATVSSVGIVRTVDVVGAGAPVVIVSAEVMAIETAAIPVAKTAVSIEGRLVNPPRRIKAPAEGTIENAVAGDKREAVIPGIPIPAGAPPARSPRSPTGVCIESGGVHIFFREIGGAQAAPAIEIILVLRLAIEFCRLSGKRISKSDFVAALDRVVGVALGHVGFAVKDAQLRSAGIEIIKAGFKKPGGSATGINENVVFRMELSDFDHGLAAVEFDFGVGEARRNHPDGSVAGQTHEDAGREEKFNFALLRIEGLAGLQFDRPDGFRIKRLHANGSLAFHVVNGSRYRGLGSCVSSESQRREESSEQDRGCRAAWQSHMPPPFASTRLDATA